MPGRGAFVRHVMLPAGALLLALAVRSAADATLGDTLPLITVFAAVAAAEWSGGWRSAVAVTIAGYFCAHWLFIAPRSVVSFADPAVVAGAIAFAATCAIVIGFGEQARRTERALRASQQVLADRVGVLNRAIAALGEREAVFRTIGEAVPDFLWLAEGDGTPVYQNPAWARYVGMDAEAFRSVGWESLHPAEDLPALKAAWTVAHRNGEPFVIDVRLRRRDGALRWFHCRTVPLHDADGVVQKWVGTMTDIHDLKQAEAQLQHAARRKDEFLALLSHELRNPLAPLRSALDVLRLRGTASAETAALYAMMERQVAQLTRLVDDLLDISRITSGALKLRHEVVCIGDVLESALETIAPQVQQAAHHLSTDIDQPAACVTGDPVRLAQMVINLLTNAVRYTPHGGSIQLTTRTTAQTVAITIADNGVGIPACDLPHIFGMFARGRNAEAVRDGLGVGLALAARLAAMHGGRIDAASEGIGRGSAFMIHLPCATRADAPAPVRVARLGDPTRQRVLIVDDNPDVADSLGMLVRSLGAEAEVLRSGQEAISALVTWRPSLVLLDLGMPGMDGFEVIESIRRSEGGFGVQVVAVTGWGQEHDRLRVASAGFDGHLVKPVTVDALDQLLSGRSPRVAARETAAGALPLGT